MTEFLWIVAVIWFMILLVPRQEKDDWRSRKY